MKECAFFLYLSPEEERPDRRKDSGRRTTTVADTSELGKIKQINRPKMGLGTFLLEEESRR